jgi:hypothetical protein
VKDQLAHAFDCFRWNNFERARLEFEKHKRTGKATNHTNYYYAQSLLALGDYANGFIEFCRMRGPLPERYKTMPIWRGEANVPVIILHECGFGDGVQLMRFIPQVRRIASSVALDMPPELQRLASQLAPLVTEKDDGYVCPLFDLMLILKASPKTIPLPPYLKPDPAWVEPWREKVGNHGRTCIGLVWSTKYGPEQQAAERRPIPLQHLLKWLPLKGEYFSLQPQERQLATRFNVRNFDITDFADVAALTSLMDIVVSVDTAALHVIGALNHPTAFGIMPYAATWRWVGNHWYPRLRLVQQTFPGDWMSAFAQIASI